MSALALPLANVTILDFSRLYPGPLATLLLADLGATVIKIEDDQRPDLLRAFAPIAVDGNSIVYHALNRGKRSIALPLINEPAKAREAIFKLIEAEKVQVIVESFKPGVFESIIGVKQLEQLFDRFPNLIIARINAFGSGELIPAFYKAIPAHDMNSLARAGILNLQETISGPLPIQIVDLLTGWSCCTQVCAALYQVKTNQQEERTRGTIIDCSMYDAALGSAIMQSSKTLSTGEKVSNGTDILIGSIPCYNIYKTANGYLTVGCLEAHFWKGFMEGINLKRFSSMNFAFAPLHSALHKEIRSAIELELSKKSALEWEDYFTSEARGKNKLPVIACREMELHLANDELVKLRRMMTQYKINSENGAKEQDVKLMHPGLDYASFLKGAANDKKAPKLGEDNHVYLQCKM